MGNENNDKYKITITDIIKGIISLIVCFLLALLGMTLFSDGLISITDFAKENYHPLFWIFVFVFALTIYGILGGISKAIAGGFSPWSLLERFKKK